MKAIPIPLAAIAAVLAAIVTLPESALAQAGDIAAAWPDVGAMKSRAATAAADDPAAAVEYLRSIPTRDDVHQQLAGVIFEKWTSHDPAAAFKAATEADFGRRAGYLTIVIGSLIASGNSEAAVDFARAADEPELTLSKPAAEWISAHPAEAAAFVAELPPSDLRERAILAAAEAVIPTDPNRAVSLIDALRGDAAIAAAEALAKAWTLQDLESARQFLAENPKGRIRYALESAVASALTASDPPAAFVWITQNLSGSSRGPALDAAILAVAAENPELADDLIQGLPKGTARIRAENTLANLSPRTDER